MRLREVEMSLEAGPFATVSYSLRFTPRSATAVRVAHSGSALCDLTMRVVGDHASGMCSTV